MYQMFDRAIWEYCSKERERRSHFWVGLDKASACDLLEVAGMHVISLQ